jgi:hypothetical protein
MHKYTTKVRAALVLACLVGAAQAQLVDPRNDPFKPLLSKWKSDAKFTSTTNEQDLQERNISWTGMFYGLIKPSGQLLLKARNG